MNARLRRQGLRYPILLTLLALGVTGSWLGWLLWENYSAGQRAAEVPATSLRWEQLRTVMIDSDQALMLTARMTATTGDPQWQERYRQAVTRLETALQQAAKLAADDRLLRYAREAQANGARLVEMENRALESIAHGNADEGRSLLFSPEYDRAKNAYVESVNRLMMEFRRRVQEQLDTQRRRADEAMIVAFAGTLFVLVAWVIAIVSARRAHHRLEMEVTARTTKLSAANDALRAAEMKYRRVVEQLPAVAYVIQPGSPDQWLYVSPKIETLLGFAADEWTAATALWRNQLHPEDRSRVLAEQASAVATGQPFATTYRLRTRDGHIRWFSDHAVVIPVQNGDPLCLHGLMQDVTEFKELEEQFRQAQKVDAIGRLAGGVAHDFNNMLTVIGGFAVMISRDASESDPVHRHAKEIERATYRAARLTRQLLAFSRRQTLQPRIVDLGALVTDLGSMLQRLIGEHIALELRVGSPAARVRVDPGQIEQVIMNLAINARDAMPAGGTLTLAIGTVMLGGAELRRIRDLTPGIYVSLRVRDTGSGMGEDTLQHLFEPFFTTKPTGQGTGLGLATCFGIVKQSGGHIAVESVLGRGTEFSIYLPRVDEPVLAQPPAAELSAVPRGTETVLVVEDEPAVRDLAALALSELGYNVWTAADGIAALEMVQRRPEPMQLLVTDLVMPRMGGKPLAEWMQQIQPDVRVLFVSGYTEESITQHGVLQAGTAFLHKPYTPGVLARKVREVLDGNPVSEVSPE